MQLTDLGKGARATVVEVRDQNAGDAVAKRMRELGFVAGEAVRVVALSPWGGDPMVVQIGATRFALRREEASRVEIRSA